MGSGRLMKIQITMTDGKKVRITLPDGLSDEQIQSEVNAVEAQYYEKYPQKTSYLQDAERRADISSTPITTRDGKVAPVNTSQLGADRVHFSDLLKLENELDQAENERAQKKTISGYYTPIKIKDGKVKPQEFKTYKFTGDRGQIVEFSGVSEKDAYDQAVASGAITPGKTSEERRNALREAAVRQGIDMGTADYAANIAPYYTQAVMGRGTTGEKVRAVAKDVASLPVRGLSGLIDAAQWVTPMSEEQPDIGRTSEEASAEGRIFEPILTSPATGAALMTGPFAEVLAPEIAGAALASRGVAGYEKAKQVAPWIAGGLEGLAATGAGVTLDENYGGSNATVDIAVSLAAPSLKPVIGKISKTGAISRIKNIFKNANNMELDDRQAELAYSIITKEGGYGSPTEVQKKALESLSAQQVPTDYSNIITEKLDFATSPTNVRGGESAKSMVESAKQYVIDKYGEGNKNVIQYYVDELYNAGDIKLDKYKSYMNRLDEFAKDQKDIYNRYTDGKMSRDVYNKRLVDMYQKYDDIPGFSEHFEDIFGSQNKMLAEIDPKGYQEARDALIKARDKMTEDEFMNAQEDLMDKWFSGKEMNDYDFQRTVDEAKLAEAMKRGILTGSTEPFSIVRPLETFYPKVKGVTSSPQAIVTSGQLLGSGARYLPTIQRMYMNDENK